MPRGRRRRRRKKESRIRTNSSSSVEIQVTENSSISIITSSIPSSSHRSFTANSYPNTTGLLAPKTELLNLLRDVGAKGTSTNDGEAFTMQELGGYLKDYIKNKKLWDQYNPLNVHCTNDPLGDVLGVTSFTRNDARGLLLENCIPVGTVHKKILPRNETGDAYNSYHGYNENLCYESGSKINQDVTSNLEPLEIDTKVTEGPHQQVTPDERKTAGPFYFDKEKQISKSSSSSAVSEKSNGDLGRKIQNKQRKKRKRNPSLEQSGVKTSKRHRGPSITLVCADEENIDGEGLYPWLLQLEVQHSDTESEVLSIQSKETALVHSSVDDWDSSDEEGIVSMAMGRDGISLEWQSVSHDPPFIEEYELESSSDEDPSKLKPEDKEIKESEKELEIDEKETSSEDEDIVIKFHHDADQEFWADYESSSDESDTSWDPDINVVEKWSCDGCHYTNSPKRSHCSRCWYVRPGWVLQKKADKKECGNNNENIPLDLLDPPDINQRIAGLPANVSALLPQSDYSLLSDKDRLGIYKNYRSISLKEELLIRESPKLFSNDLQQRTFIETKSKTCTITGPTQSSQNVTFVTELETNGNQSLGSHEPGGEVISPSEKQLSSGGCEMKTSFNTSLSASLSSSPSKLMHCDSGISMSPSLTPATDIDTSGWDILAEDPSLKESPLYVPPKISEQIGSFKLSSRTENNNQVRTSSQMPDLLDIPMVKSNDSDCSTTIAAKDDVYSDRNYYRLKECVHTPHSVHTFVGGGSTSVTYMPPHYVQTGEKSRIEPCNGGTALTMESQDLLLTPPSTNGSVKDSAHNELMGVVSQSETSSDTVYPSSVASNDAGKLCIVCLSRPKEASIIHGKTGHQCCCYRCAKRLRRYGKPCPVCRRNIQRVVKNYFV